MKTNDPSDTPLIRELRARIHELEREVADLERHNHELREAVTALLGPPKDQEFATIRL